MKQLQSIILEKLKIGKNIKLWECPQYGEGQTLEFQKCKLTGADKLLTTTELFKVWDILYTYIKPKDKVYFIQSTGHNLSACKEVANDFKTAIRQCSLKNTIVHDNLFPDRFDGTLKVMKIQNYNNINEIIVVQYQNWTTDTPTTCWYIKL